MTLAQGGKKYLLKSSLRLRNMVTFFVEATPLLPTGTKSMTFSLELSYKKYLQAQKSFSLSKARTDRRKGHAPSALTSCTDDTPPSLEPWIQKLR